jgi:hypothetical protein
MMPRTVDVALCEKPYELPSQTIWSAKSAVICRLLSNFKSGLTVKIRNRMTKKFYRQIYRQIYRQNGSAGASDVDKWIKVNFYISTSYTEPR